MTEQRGKNTMSSTYGRMIFMNWYLCPVQILLTCWSFIRRCQILIIHWFRRGNSQQRIALSSDTESLLGRSGTEDKAVAKARRNKKVYASEQMNVSVSAQSFSPLLFLTSCLYLLPFHPIHTAAQYHSTNTLSVIIILLYFISKG